MNKRKNTKSAWTLDQRQSLELLAKEGHGTATMADVLEKTKPAILAELRKGISETEFKNRQYVKYNKRKALLSELSSNYGEDVLEYLGIEPFSDNQMEG